jgi:hypothetical protein
VWCLEEWFHHRAFGLESDNTTKICLSSASAYRSSVPSVGFAFSWKKQGTDPARLAIQTTTQGSIVPKTIIPNTREPPCKMEKNREQTPSRTSAPPPSSPPALAPASARRGAKQLWVLQKMGDRACATQCSFHPHPPSPSPASGRGGERMVG